MSLSKHDNQQPAKSISSVIHLFIRTANSSPFASVRLAGLSRLSYWWIRLGIYPERIEPGHPQVKRMLEQANVRVNFTIESLLRKDSIDMTDADRV